MHSLVKAGSAPNLSLTSVTGWTVPSSRPVQVVMAQRGLRPTHALTSVTSRVGVGRSKVPSTPRLC